jgi:hypothetical protein
MLPAWRHLARIHLLLWCFWSWRSKPHPSHASREQLFHRCCMSLIQERGAGKAERRTQRRAGFAMLEQLEADMKSGGQGGLWKKKHKK